MQISPRDVLPAPTKDQIRAAAVARVREAMRRIENAQNELAAACYSLDSANVDGLACRLSAGTRQP